MLELLLLWVIVGLLPGYVAQRKGYSFAGWWIFGALLPFVAIPWALLMGPNEQTRLPCPWCRTVIDREARVCSHCGRDVHEFYARGLGAPPPPAPDLDRRPWAGT